MHIYVDESGGFVPRQAKVSGMFALVIPGSDNDKVLAEFGALLHQFGVQAGELKGSQMSEAQIARVIGLARKHGLLLETVLLDLSDHTEETVLACRDGQAAGYIVNIDEATPSRYVTELMDLRTAVLRLSPQLYAQACAVTFLLRRVFEHASAYFAQRVPEELAEFEWWVDGKGDGITPFEHYWSTAIRPLLSMWSKEAPLMFLPFGDYSRFAKFQTTVDGIEKVDPTLLFGDNVHFTDSRASLGIQLVDILGSAVTRAFNGSLSERGWRDIGGLIIARQPQSVNFLQLRHVKGVPSVRKRSPHAIVVDQMKIGNVPLLTAVNFAEVDRQLRAQNTTWVEPTKGSAFRPAPPDSGASPP